MLNVTKKAIFTLVMAVLIVFPSQIAVMAEKSSAENILTFSNNEIILDIGETASGNKTEIEGIKAVISDEENKKISVEFEAPESGFYTVGIKYYPLEGTGLNFRRRILIDSKQAFSEDSFLLYRRWRDSGKSVVNSVGDEVKAGSEQIVGWFEQSVTDSLGLESTPLELEIEKGTHTLTFEYIDQPAAISQIKLSSPKSVPNYSTYSSAYDKSGESGKYLYFEAEDPDFAAWRTESAAGVASDGDPQVSPAGVTNIKYNVFGGYAWRSAGQTACWKFNIETAGYYKINIRSKQSWGGNLPVYRNIVIDGKQTFSELNEYKFAYSREWYSEVLGDEKGDFLFWLEDGEHTIEMTPVMGSIAGIYNELEKALLDLSAIVRRVVMITGQDPDPNYDYSIKTAIPNIGDDLSAVRQRVADCISKADEAAGKSSVFGNQLESVEKQLGEMIADIEKIPRRLTDLNKAVISLGDWLATLQESPLAIDYLEIAPPDKEIDFSHSSFLDKIWATLKNFTYSFVKDYNALGDTGADAKTTIEVWVGRGKEWAEVLKNLCDSEFVKESGIAVKMNVIPSGQLASSGSVNPLLLAVSAGNAPDAALGVASTMPVEYAIRNAVADLSVMEGFDNVKSGILEQLLVPFEYSGGIYGLPETMYFRCMFYRKDIVEEYKITLPDTWTQMYKETLPRIYENGMQVYIPAWMDTFLLSNGGSFYTEDGKASALDTKEAYVAFEQYIETYTVYGAPTSANFFNRFRTGEMPIGLDGYALYVQLIAAAPELSGLWGIMPIPGVENSDGTVNRNTPGYVGESDIILQQSNKKEAAWEFIKWWLSEDVQTKYGREIEGRMGAQARWSTSNLKAFKSLPWNIADLEIISDSWENVVETPVVPGSYFTGRHLTNAWNRCVINNMEPRESLEICVKEINKELKRRQAQFGID